MELKDITQQCLLVQHELGSQLQWIHSSIITDKMVCLYDAEDETILREHARQSGLPIQRISEVSAIIGPNVEEIA